MKNFLVELNRHWSGEKFQAGTKRELLKAILDIVDLDQVIAITGIRRCGKSFLLKQIINQLLKNKIAPKNILFINFDYPAFIGQNAEDLLDEIMDQYFKLMEPEGNLYIFFDEIQNIPKWEIWIKYQYDLHKGKYKFFLTGSNNALLSSDFSSRLSGRIIEKHLFPFSFVEFLKHYHIKTDNELALSRNRIKILRHFDNFLNYGAMPEILNIKKTNIKIDLLSSYFNTVIYKDLAIRFNIRDVLLLKEFSLYLLGHTTNIVNLKKLANYFSMSRDLAREFIKYLEMSFFLYSVKKFSFSSKKQLLSQKKSFSIDNGFCSTLPFKFSPDQGMLLENLVFIELKRRYKEVFYIKETNECDFIVKDNQQNYLAIQVCYELNENNKKREIKGLITANSYFHTNINMILTYNQNDTFFYDGIQIDTIPIWEWML